MKCEYYKELYGQGRCSGTKDFEACNCSGELTKCTFYPDTIFKNTGDYLIEYRYLNTSLKTLCVKAKDWRDAVAKFYAEQDAWDGMSYVALRRALDAMSLRDAVLSIHKLTDFEIINIYEVKEQIYPKGGEAND